jgi:hypothetical protein
VGASQVFSLPLDFFWKISKLEKEGSITNISTKIKIITKMFSSLQKPQGHSVKILLNKLNVSKSPPPPPKNPGSSCD